MADRCFFQPPTKNKQIIEKTYGALFNNYYQERMADKATVLFQKFKELNRALNSLIYNNLMTLYMKLGQPEKVFFYFQELKYAVITPDRATFKVNDIDSVEIVREMKNCAHHVLDWTTYCNLAIIYNSSGLFEKSAYVLKKAEEIMNGGDQTSYHFLVSLCAGTVILANTCRHCN